MYKMNLNELAALQLVLDYVPLKDLLVSAMNNFAEKEDVRSQENADLCSKAINTFLN